MSAGSADVAEGCTGTYTERQLADLDFGGTVAFLHKPFRAIDLTGAVRRSLAPAHES